MAIVILRFLSRVILLRLKRILMLCNVHINLDNFFQRNFHIYDLWLIIRLFLDDKCCYIVISYFI